MIPALVVCLSLISGDLATRRSPVVQVVERVSPAVVLIGTVQIVEQRFRSRSPIDDYFFGPQVGQRAVEGLGSGVIIDPSGTIITNEHVIRGASEIHVVLADGRQLDAEVLGSDADTDLAVLKVKSRTPLPSATLGTSSDLMIGETAIAIGSPLGLKKTVTVGVVSAVGRTIRHDDRVYNDFIQTDASINPGNSGGPLLNIDGEIIGVNSAIIASAQNIGFAIPADKVRRIVAELTQYGKVRPAWVGLTAIDLVPDLAARTGWDRTYGALIADIETDSPADKAGLKVGDVVASVGTTQVEDGADLRSRVRSFTAKSPVALKLFRAGQFLDVTISPTEFPAAQVDATLWTRTGLRVRFAKGRGLVITAVRDQTPAARIGLEPGDVILRVNNATIASDGAYRDAIINARAKESVLLLVRRGNRGYYLTLPF